MIVFATYMYGAKTIIRVSVLGEKLSSVIVDIITNVFASLCLAHFAIVNVYRFLQE